MDNKPLTTRKFALAAKFYNKIIDDIQNNLWKYLDILNKSALLALIDNNSYNHTDTRAPSKREDIEITEFTDTSVSFKYEISSGCACHPDTEYHNFDLPMEFFTDFEIFLVKEELKYQQKKTAREKEKEIKEQKRVKELEQAKLVAAEREKAEYLKLHEKYGKNN